MHENTLFQALQYENNGDIFIVTGPITEPRIEDDERILHVASDLIFPDKGCPVICHGLVSASHLNSKVGDVRALHNSAELDFDSQFTSKKIRIWIPRWWSQQIYGSYSSCQVKSSSFFWLCSLSTPTFTFLDRTSGHTSDKWLGNHLGEIVYDAYRIPLWPVVMANDCMTWHDTVLRRENQRCSTAWQW